MHTSLKSLATALCLACSLAFAQTAPKPEQPRHIDFTQALMGIDGKKLVRGDAKQPETITLGDIAVQALETPLEEDKQMQGDAKFKLDLLARRIYRNADVVLSVEDTALLKQRIGKAYGPMVVGAAWRLLDPAEK